MKLMPFRALWLCFALVAPLAAQTDSIPWDILGSRNIVTPFNQAGLYDSTLLPSGAVLLSGNTCNADPINFSITYGNTTGCGLALLRVNAAGLYDFAVRLGSVDSTFALLTDSNGNIVIVGMAESSTFLTTPGAYLPTAPDAAFTGNYAARFACKLRGTDGTPLYCTFLDDSAALPTLDTAGDLLFTTSAATAGTIIVELNPAGAKLLQTALIPGSITSIAPNPDGTLYLANQTQAGTTFGRFNLPTGFVSTQVLAGAGSLTIALQPSAGPVLAGNLGSGFAVRQYAADGMTIVYEDSFPLVASATLSVVDGGVVLAGYSNSSLLPLVHNVHVCGQIPAPGSVNSPLMIRLDAAGTVLQSTWLGAASFGSLVGVGGGWSALGSLTGNASAFARNAYVQVISLGPNTARSPRPSVVWSIWRV